MHKRQLSNVLPILEAMKYKKIIDCCQCYGTSFVFMYIWNDHPKLRVQFLDNVIADITQNVQLFNFYQLMFFL